MIYVFETNFGMKLVIKGVGLCMYKIFFMNLILEEHLDYEGYDLNFIKRCVSLLRDRSLVAAANGNDVLI